MQEENTNKYINNFNDEVDLRELFNILYKEKWIIFAVTTSISIIAVIYSLLLPNIYESKALLAPNNASTNISGALKSYNNIAGLAGISLPNSSDDDNSAKALEKIRSLSFFTSNILTNIHLPDLMAAKYWDSENNSMIYNENIYNKNNENWVKEYFHPQKQPSAQQSFRAFKSKHLNIYKDKQSGFITLSIKHQSPFVAKQWADVVVREINTFYREKDRLEAEKAVAYINNQILTTSLYEVKQVLAQLLEEEIKKLTLIEANKSYVFNYIDPPAVMELKSEPSRSLICIMGSMLGVMLGVLLALIRYYYFKKTI